MIMLELGTNEHVKKRQTWTTIHHFHTNFRTLALLELGFLFDYFPLCYYGSTSENQICILNNVRGIDFRLSERSCAIEQIWVGYAGRQG